MKLIYVVIDGISAFPNKEQENETLLSVAHTTNLDKLSPAKVKLDLCMPLAKGLRPK